MIKSLMFAMLLLAGVQGYGDVSSARSLTPEIGTDSVSAGSLVPICLPRGGCYPGGVGF